MKLPLLALSVLTLALIPSAHAKTKPPIRRLSFVPGLTAANLFQVYYAPGSVNGVMSNYDTTANVTGTSLRFSVKQSWNLIVEPNVTEAIQIDTFTNRGQFYSSGPNGKFSGPWKRDAGGYTVTANSTTGYRKTVRYLFGSGRTLFYSCILQKVKKLPSGKESVTLVSTVSGTFAPF